MLPMTVLCLDDEEVLLHLLEAALSTNGYAVLTAISGCEALKIAAAAHHLDAVILDYDVPDMNGGEVAREVKGIRPQTPIIMFSGADDIPSSALTYVDGFARKGESVNALLGILHRLLHRPGPKPLASRRFPRYSVQLPFSVLTQRSGKLAVFQGVSTDIGEGGVGGAIEGTLVPGEKVLLHVSRQMGEVVGAHSAQVCYRNDDCYGFAFLDAQ